MTNGGVLLVICLVLFLSFLPTGIVLSTLFGRRPEGIGRLYFADLFGAAVACAIAVPLIASAGPPATIMFSALLVLVAGVRIALAPPDTVVARRRGGRRSSSRCACWLRTSCPT